MNCFCPELIIGNQDEMADDDRRIPEMDGRYGKPVFGKVRPIS